MASLQDDDQSDDEEKKNAEAIEDILTHFIQIGYYDENLKAHENENGQYTDSFSHLGTVDENDGPAAFTAGLQGVAFFHVTAAALPKMRFADKFEGVLVDTGAARGSRARVIQYKAYYDFVGEKSSLVASHAAVCHFGTGSATLLGIALISFPVGYLRLPFNFNVLDDFTTVLLSLDDMDRRGVYLNNFDDTAVHSHLEQKKSIKRIYGHPVIQKSTHLSCLLTTVELR